MDKPTLKKNMYSIIHLWQNVSFWNELKHKSKSKTTEIWSCPGLEHSRLQAGSLQAGHQIWRKWGREIWFGQTNPLIHVDVCVFKNKKSAFIMWLLTKSSASTPQTLSYPATTSLMAVSEAPVHDVSVRCSQRCVCVCVWPIQVNIVPLDPWMSSSSLWTEQLGQTFLKGCFRSGSSAVAFRGDPCPSPGDHPGDQTVRPLIRRLSAEARLP